MTGRFGNKVRYYRPPAEGLPEGDALLDLLNSLRTEYALEGGIPEDRRDLTCGYLSTLVWNIRNRYSASPDAATFTADEMRMVVEGFLAEVVSLRLDHSGSQLGDDG